MADDPRLTKSDKRIEKTKCEYRKLTSDEIILIDPHRIKGKGGGKRDLSVCVGNDCPDRGEVVEHIKNKRPDEDGIPMRPQVDNYEPIGINVEDPEFRERLKDIKRPTTTQIFVHFYVTGFKASSESVLERLGLDADGIAFWKKGEPRGPGLTIMHKQNGFKVAADPDCSSFEECVLNVLKKVHRVRRKLAKIPGGCETELSVGAYIFEEGFPELRLPAEAIGMLYELQAEVDFDLYFLV